MKNKITIDGKIYDALELSYEANTETNIQEVLGLWGLPPGLYETLITHHTYFATVELDNERNPFRVHEPFDFSWEKKPPQKGWIVSMRQRGGGVELEIRTMPTQKARFIPR